MNRYDDHYTDREYDNKDEANQGSSNSMDGHISNESHDGYHPEADGGKNKYGTTHDENIQNNDSIYKEPEKDTDGTPDTEKEHTKQQPASGLGTAQKPKKGKSPDGKRSGSSRLGHIASAFTGGIISAALVIGLIFSGLIPLENAVDTSDDDTSPSNEETTTGTSDEQTQTVSLDETEKTTGIDEASDAVVGIKNMQKQGIWDPGQEAGSGSGIIYKKEEGKAYIVTNNHVVENAKEVEVVLNNKEQVKAKVLGNDEITDLAVLEIDGDKVDTTATFGDSENLTVGDTVVAIGNPLGEEFYGSVTRGIISGLNRSIEVDTSGNNQPDWIAEVIQTDAAINPGNSGGALVNANGEVIGINSMKIARQQVEGIGFAIPIDTAQPIIEQLENEGEITRPFIGVSTAAIEQVPMQYQDQIKLPDDVDGGMVVANVESGSPADEAGLQQFDVITEINGEEITSMLELRKFLYDKTEADETVKMNYYRDGEQEKTEIQLTERDITN